MSRGKFILIEGGDGAGKDTHVDLLKQQYGETNFVFTREPGGTHVGKTLREMLLHNTHGPISLPAEMFLFMADRAQHVEELIKPSLAAGKHVVSNRSWVSFLAYQIHAREQYDWHEFLKTAIERVYKDAPADLVIVLDVPPSVGKERQRAMGKIPDVMESMIDAAHSRIRQAYLDIAKTLPHAVVIDAARPKDEVWKDVYAAVQSVL